MTILTVSHSLKTPVKYHSANIPNAEGHRDDSLASSCSSSLTILVNPVAFALGRFAAVHAAERFQLHAFGHGHLVVVAALHGFCVLACFDYGFFFFFFCLVVGWLENFVFGPLVDGCLCCSSSFFSLV